MKKKYGIKIKTNDTRDSDNDAVPQVKSVLFGAAELPISRGL